MSCLRINTPYFRIQPDVGKNGFDDMLTFDGFCHALIAISVDRYRICKTI